MSHENSSRRRSGVVRLALASALALGALALPAPPRCPRASTGTRCRVERRAGDRQLDQRQHEPVRSGPRVVPDAEVDATLLLSGYAHMFTCSTARRWRRSSVPMGRISGEVTAVGTTLKQSTAGFATRCSSST